MNFPSLPKTQREFCTELWPHKIKYRAFTAGQQSLFLAVADQDTPISERVQTMADIFNQCVDAGVPFQKLPSAIVEKVFLLMRSISIGELLPIRYKCSNQIVKEPGSEKKECGQEVVLNIDLNKIGIVVPEGYKDNFELAGGYFIKMRIPAYGDLLRLDKANIQELIAACTECLYKGEEVWPIDDPYEDGLTADVAKARKETYEEFVSWVAENIESDVLSRISTDFFKKQMHIYFKSSIKCPNCGFEHKIEINSVNQIFI